METALLKLANEYETGQVRATPRSIEPRDLNSAAENWLRRAERAWHPVLRDVCRTVADSYSKLACA